MAKTAREIVQSERFKSLMRKRWTVSVILTIILFVIYYGYILIVGYGKTFLGVKVGVYQLRDPPRGVGDCPCPGC